jgi:hypothetical protein
MVIHNAILTGSISMQAPPVISGSLTLTGSITSTGPITGSGFFTAGTITAQTLVVQIVSSSIDFVTGSTKFGSLTTNTHQFTGSMFVTGALSGTSATFSNAITANGVYSNTSDVALIVSAQIPAINLRTGNAGRFTIATSFANPNTTSFVVGTGTNNPSIQAILLDHSTGNIGVGTISPTYQLDLSGGTTVNERLRLQRGSDDTNQFAVYGWNSIRTYRANVSVASALTDFSIIQSGSDGSRTPFYISSAGNVGIGVSTNPQNLLEVSTAGGSPRIRVGTLQNNNNTARFEAITSATVSTANSAWLRVTPGGGFVLGTSSYTKSGGDSGNFANLSSESEASRIEVTSGGEIVRGPIREFAQALSPPDPYTGDARLNITHTPWGGNNDSGTVYVEFQARAYGNNQTTCAYGIITYRLGDNGINVTNVSTAGVTTSNVTITTDVSTSYILRITFGVTQNTDRISVFARTTNGVVSSISANIV